MRTSAAIVAGLSVALGVAVAGQSREQTPGSVDVARLESWASFARATSRVVITRAVKQGESSSNRRLRVYLRNIPSLPPSVQATALGIGDAESWQIVGNIVVSVKDENHVVVGLPYSRTVARLSPDEEVAVDFRLLDDVNTAMIALSYSGRVEEQLFRLRADGARPLRLMAKQVSLEAELGQSAVYEVGVERLSSEVRLVQLSVTGLPAAFGWDFQLDARDASNAISRYAFPEGEAVRSFALRVHLPEQRSGELAVALDAPVQFRVTALDVTEADTPSRRISSESATRRGSTFDLMLLPKGVAKLDVSLDNYFAEVGQGAFLDLSPTITNAGSRDVRAVLLKVESPLGWRTHVDAARASALASAATEEMRVRLEPSAGTPPGDYQIRLLAEGQSSGAKVSSETRQVRVRILAPARSGLSTVLALALLTLVVGIGYMGFKLHQR